MKVTAAVEALLQTTWSAGSLTVGVGLTTTVAVIGAPGQPLAVGVIVKVTVTEATDIALTLLFDPEHDLEERILKEQFDP